MAKRYFPLQSGSTGEKQGRIPSHKDVDVIVVHTQAIREAISHTQTRTRQTGAGTCVGLAVFDTLLLPAKDCPETHYAITSGLEWRPVRLDRKKLPHLGYLAFCLGKPVCGVTHYAKITHCRPGEDGRVVFRFAPPVQLPEKAACWPPDSRGPNTPRYTTLSLLLEAKKLEDLFE